jgi:hypothetical protein
MPYEQDALGFPLSWMMHRLGVRRARGKWRIALCKTRPATTGGYVVNGRIRLEFRRLLTVLSWLPRRSVAGFGTKECWSAKSLSEK